MLKQVRLNELLQRRVYVSCYVILINLVCCHMIYCPTKCSMCFIYYVYKVFYSYYVGCCFGAEVCDGIQREVQPMREQEARVGEECEASAATSIHGRV